MDKKPRPFASKAQAARVYEEFRAGKISYGDMMAIVHQTDFTKIPDRIKEKKVDPKIALAMKGLV